MLVDFKDKEIMKYLNESGDNSLEGVTHFVASVKKGQADPYMKSEDIPVESHEEFVRVLVGKNFEEIVMDNTKDVLVEFYAPWCGHCQKLAPIYSKLAE